MKFLVAILSLAGALFAQVRQVNMNGMLREKDDRSISIELADSRIVTFKIARFTQFNDGLTLQALQPGSRLRVEGTQDAESYLTATGIFSDGAATAADRPQSANTVLRRPAAADPDDSGPPVLRRGKPTQVASAAPAAPSVNAPPDDRPSDSSLKGVRDRPVGEYEAAISPASHPVRDLNPKEALIERAREWALNFTDNLPNYVCQQFTTRYVRIPGSREWHAQDVVSANVVYENGKEDYRNLAINGKPVNKKMEELPGSWSTGEFGTTLRSLFHPGRQAEFTFVKQSQMNGFATWAYDYKVRRENSDWRIQLGSQSIIPAYAGRVWIDEKTAQVLRIEMSAVDIPKEFQLDQVEASNDYGFVRLSSAEQYMLPTHAETLSCERGSPACSRNTIDFRNYHKYSGEANIVFDK